MLMNGTTIKDTQMSNDMHNLDMFLESEKNMNRSEPWSKLDKTNKQERSQNLWRRMQTNTSSVMRRGHSWWRF